MVIFRELRITPDGKKLIIDASVKNLSYYTNVFLDAIIIDSQDTYVAGQPSSKPIFYHEITNTDSIVYDTTDLNKPIREEENKDIVYVNEGEKGGEKRIRLELDAKSLGVNLSTTLFFVYVVTKGTPAIDTPCNMDNQTTLGVVADLYPFYRSTLGCMKEVENSCDVPKTFIDKLLRFKALELCIKTGNYSQAIKYWNKFFRKIKSTVVTKCRCNG